jgi:hypothetical protein
MRSAALKARTLRAPRNEQPPGGVTGGCFVGGSGEEEAYQTLWYTWTGL